jgi:hypothetical protein
MAAKKRSMRGDIAQLRDPAEAGKIGNFATQAKAMEEDVEFSNVTNFRNSLLGAVERLQSNPAKRFVITKRGEPEAVLMSYKTYSLLTRVMNQALEKSAGEGDEGSVREAFARMRRERQFSAPALSMPTAAAAPDRDFGPAVGAAATPADAGPALSSLLDKVQAIRRQFDELDDTLKRQDQSWQAPAAKPVQEK